MIPRFSGSTKCDPCQGLGTFRQRKLLLEKSAPLSGTLLDFVVLDRHSLLEFFWYCSEQSQSNRSRFAEGSFEDVLWQTPFRSSNNIFQSALGQKKAANLTFLGPQQVSPFLTSSRILWVMKFHIGGRAGGVPNLATDATQCLVHVLLHMMKEVREDRWAKAKGTLNDTWWRRVWLGAGSWRSRHCHRPAGQYCRVKISNRNNNEEVRRGYAH